MLPQTQTGTDRFLSPDFFVSGPGRGTGKKNRQENDKKCFVVAELGDAEVMADTHSPPLSLSFPPYLSFPSLSVIWA